MRPGSILAIYLLFWTVSLFLVLPWGVRTGEEEGAEPVPGHAESAPHRFSLGKAALRATLVSTLFFGLFYANYICGWIGIDGLTWARPPGR